MMPSFKELKIAALMGLLSLWSINVYATEANSEIGPHEVVSQATQEVLTLLESGIDMEADKEGFIDQASAVLDPYIASRVIAKGVMGKYKNLASDEQIDEFTEKFKRGLFNIYGGSIKGFSDLDIAVIPPEKPVEGKSATVIQEISSSGGVTRVSYSMRKNRQGQWKMVNLILNGINFGKTFRGQFAAEVEKNQGDLAKTISEWEQSMAGGV